MEHFDVIIVGGGPAGLECARTLSSSERKILLLEKKEVFGEKLCAGGLTMKDMEVLEIPDRIIEHHISRAALYSPRKSACTDSPVPFLFTVDRLELGAWQRELLNGTSVEVRNGSQVASVSSNALRLRVGTEISFEYLVGADGYASVVRRSLGLATRKRLIGFQYTLPAEIVDPVLKIYLDSRRFGAWYAWSFPHRDSVALGCCCDPEMIDHRKVRDGFIAWLNDKGIDPGDAKLESSPISYDYRGYHFDNVFLVGEAAGLASGFTGEGVYQALASGQEVARLILDPAHRPVLLEEVLRYNRILEKILKFLYYSGPLKGVFHGALLALMQQKGIRDRINRSFSPSLG